MNRHRHNKCLQRTPNRAVARSGAVEARRYAPYEEVPMNLNIIGKALPLITISITVIILGIVFLVAYLQPPIRSEDRCDSTSSSDSKNNSTKEIVKLEFRNGTVTVFSSSEGKRYSVKNLEGQQLGSFLTEKQLEGQFPEQYSLVKKMHADLVTATGPDL